MSKSNKKAPQAAALFTKRKDMLSDYVLIGAIIKPQGINGLVKIKPITDNPERFLGLENLFVSLPEENQQVLMQIEEVTVREGFVYFRLNHSVTRDEAEKQRGLFLYVKRQDAVELDEDQHFIADLIGCRVLDSKGNELGKLIEVLQPGANDVYVIKLKNNKTMMLPALKRVVPTVDIINRQISINEGLLDEVAVIED